MGNCLNCKFYGPLGIDWNPVMGECKNKKVYDDNNRKTLSLVHAGGEEGYGDYFHVHEDFGCIKFIERI